MREIPLTQGQVALVSDEDYEYLMQWKWKAQRNRNHWYAVRNQHIGRENGKSKSKSVYMHRLILERAGVDLKHFVDHKDRNGLNNQRDNLREVTHAENLQNLSSHKKNSSGFRGVSWNKEKGCWQSRIQIDRKQKHLGWFSDKDEAIKVRLEAEKKYFTHSENCN